MNKATMNTKLKHPSVRRRSTMPLYVRFISYKAKIAFTQLMSDENPYDLKN